MIALIFGPPFEQALADEKHRQLVRNRLRHDYLAPALMFMKQVSTSGVTSPQYLAALIAYSEERHEDALDPGQLHE